VVKILDMERDQVYKEMKLFSLSVGAKRGCCAGSNEKDFSSAPNQWGKYKRLRRK